MTGLCIEPAEKEQRLASAKEWYAVVVQVRNYVAEHASPKSIESLAKRGDELSLAVIDQIARVAITQLPTVHAALQRRATRGDPRAIDLYLRLWDPRYRQIIGELQQGKDGANRGVEDALGSVLARLGAYTASPVLTLSQTTTVQSVRVGDGKV